MKKVTFINVTPDTVPSVVKRDILKTSTSNIRRFNFFILDYKTNDW